MAGQWWVLDGSGRCRVLGVSMGAWGVIERWEVFLWGGGCDHALGWCYMKALVVL